MITGSRGCPKPHAVETNLLGEKATSLRRPCVPSLPHPGGGMSVLNFQNRQRGQRSSPASGYGSPRDEAPSGGGGGGYESPYGRTRMQRGTSIRYDPVNSRLGLRGHSQGGTYDGSSLLDNLRDG